MRLEDYESMSEDIKQACVMLTDALTKAHGTDLQVSVIVKSAKEIPAPIEPLADGTMPPAPLMFATGGEPYAVEATISLPF